MTQGYVFEVFRKIQMLLVVEKKDRFDRTKKPKLNVKNTAKYEIKFAWHMIPGGSILPQCVATDLLTRAFIARQHSSEDHLKAALPEGAGICHPRSDDITRT